MTAAAADPERFGDLPEIIFLVITVYLAIPHHTSPSCGNHRAKELLIKSNDTI